MSFRTYSSFRTPTFRKVAVTDQFQTKIQAATAPATDAIAHTMAATTAANVLQQPVTSGVQIAATSTAVSTDTITSTFTQILDILKDSGSSNLGNLINLIFQINKMINSPGFTDSVNHDSANQTDNNITGNTLASTAPVSTQDTDDADPTSSNIANQTSPVTQQVVDPAVDEVSAGVVVTPPEYDGDVIDTAGMPASVVYGSANSRPANTEPAHIMKSVIDQHIHEDNRHSGTSTISKGTDGNDTVLYVSPDNNQRDYIALEGGDDRASGGNSNDFILGGNGNDIIDGGVGDDMLSGGMGNDIITGGSGNDIFYFNAALYLDAVSSVGIDRIKDFEIGDKDDIIFVVKESDSTELMERLSFDFDEVLNETTLIYKDADQVERIVAVFEGVDLETNHAISDYVIAQQYTDLSAIV